MGKTYDINVALRGRDEGAGGAVENLAKKMRALRLEARQSGESALISGIRRPEEMIGQLMGGMNGALLAVGVGMVTAELDRSAQEAEKLRNEWDHLTPSDKAYQIATMIPIVGELVRATSGLVSIWGGVDETVQQTAAHVKELKDASEEWLRNITEGHKLDAVLDKMSHQTAEAHNQATDRVERSHMGKDSQYREEAAEGDRYWNLRKSLDAQIKELSVKQNAAGFTKIERSEMGEQIEKLNKEKELNEQQHAANMDLIGVKGNDRRVELEQSMGEEILQNDGKIREERLRLAGQSLQAGEATVREEERARQAALRKELEDKRDAGMLNDQIEKDFAIRESQIRLDADTQIEELEKQHQDRLRDLQGQVYVKRLHGLHESLDAQLEEIRESYARQMREAKDFNERLLLLQMEQQDEQNAVQAHEEHLSDMRGEIAEKALRLQGKTLDADILALRRGYDEKYRVAKSAEEKHLLMVEEKEDELGLIRSKWHVSAGVGHAGFDPRDLMMQHSDLGAWKPENTGAAMQTNNRQNETIIGLMREFMGWLQSKGAHGSGSINYNTYDPHWTIR